MSEKRIKGTFISKHREDVDSYHWVIEVPAADFNVANFGTEVEIVYREPEIEIKAGQRWRNGRSVYRVIYDANDRWAIDFNGFIQKWPGWTSKAELQAWLNEHATLAEGESE